MDDDQFDVLDLRHFSGAQLAPMLREEGARWQRRHRWDYSKSIDLLLEYLDSRVLPGFVAVERGRGRRILGYSFCVYEAAKAVVGDVYAFGEAEGAQNPVCVELLRHVVEMLQSTPGVERIESQLLMFPAGGLDGAFLPAGFVSHPRLFLFADLGQPEFAPLGLGVGSELGMERWRPEHFNEAAELIHRAYIGHGDSLINDQYQTVAGAQRFLHNIIRFPGCGVFDTESSWVLRDRQNGLVQGVILASRVRPDVAHITQVCLNPALRGLGLGKVLMTQCAASLRMRGVTGMSLTVTEANAQARGLYDALGFRTLQRFEAMTWDKVG